MSPADRLYAVRSRISEAARGSGRNKHDITLIAVSKTHPASAVRQLALEGHTDFGENYLKEAAGKIHELESLSIVWHFIGHIQSNKCSEIAELFDWVHSVDRLKIARRLNDAAGQFGKRLNVLIQVNIDGEASKSGVSPDQVPDMVEAIRGFTHLQLRGLMTIPKPSDDPQQAREPYKRLHDLLDAANSQSASVNGARLDCLSMGMSADLEAAVAEGASHVRIGTALFGPRHYPAEA